MFLGASRFLSLRDRINVEGKRSKATVEQLESSFAKFVAGYEKLSETFDRYLVSENWRHMQLIAEARSGDVR
jgi:hypothetical protein